MNRAQRRALGAKLGELAREPIEVRLYTVTALVLERRGVLPSTSPGPRHALHYAMRSMTCELCTRWAQALIRTGWPYQEMIAPDYSTFPASRHDELDLMLCAECIGDFTAAGSLGRAIGLTEVQVAEIAGGGRDVEEVLRMTAQRMAMS